MGKKITRICTILARGGSKGIKDKNIKVAGGKPLLAYSIDHAIKSGLFDVIAVSSDSDKILATAKRWGAELVVKRPAELASDKSAKVPGIQHCVLEAERALGKKGDIVVDLCATSPLILPSDIVNCVRNLEKLKVSNVITGSPSRRNPYFNMVEIVNDVAKVCKTPARPFVRRQDCPRCYDMNASIYVWIRDIFMARPGVWYKDTAFYEMPEARSVDIDNESDLDYLRFLMKKKGNQ